ncbi:MAG: ABC transporter ATP-binding protein [Clostridia bacterium]|nr:ABC transporter ATP-binding protein [Clostridia bacterium]
MSLIQCENLAVGYDHKDVLSGLTFTINPGDYLCIVGENGSGKTTLMKTLLGLLPPVSGTIQKDDSIKQCIGYLPQQSDVQKDFPASVWEVVLSGCQSHMGLRPFYNKNDKTLALENINRMGLENLKNRCYRELSGGQQQRDLLARALCATQNMLLLDEPVSGLDPKVTEEMYALIKSLNDDGITILMISHDTSRALQYASHILDVGQKIFFGTKEDYVKAGEHNG